MKMRSVTSLTASLSFVLMVLTSIVLYVVPQGRVAYWADWRLWGLTKTDWGNIHINLGLLFLVSLFLHIYYNWKPLVSYLKDKGRQFRLFTLEFNVALIITLAFSVGTYFLIPPFGWVMALNEHLKDSGAETYGEPPYGHAELSSLKTFAQKMDLDLDQSMALLEKAGCPVENPESTLADISRKYGVSPQQIYLAIRTAKRVAEVQAGPALALPATAPPGTGNLTLADFCARFGQNLKQVERELKKKGIAASAELTLKKIAANNQTNPTDIYQAIVALVNDQVLKTELR